MKKELTVIDLKKETAITIQAICDKYAGKRIPSYRIFPGFEPPLQAAAICPQEKTVLAADSLGVVRLLDNATGRCRMAIQPNAGPVVSVGISPDVKAAFLKTAGGDKYLLEPGNRPLVSTGR